MENDRLSSLILMRVHRSFAIDIEDFMGLHVLKGALDGSLLTSNSAPVFVTNFMFIFNMVGLMENNIMISLFKLFMISLVCV